MVTSVVNKH